LPSGIGHQATRQCNPIVDWEVLSHARFDPNGPPISEIRRLLSIGTTDGTAMSEVKPLSLPFTAVPAPHELDDLIERIVQKTLAQVGYAAQSNPFINSKACAELLGVSSEHLCAMRARGEGPPWSGEGKWIRYRRSEVIRWLDQLPTTHQDNH
jgi:predicted DNA-binding transcriptional regulator AlpA